MAEAYVTLVTSTDYVPGVETLAFSLRESGTSRPILCLATPAVLTDANIKSRMLRAFDAIVEVDLIDSRAFHQLQLLGRPELGVTFTKLHVWNLTQFKRAIYLDADTLVLRNIDDLFTRDLGTLGIAAAPDVGWPDCFNSGLFVCEPNAQTFVALKAMAAARTSVGGGSFDGADQGLLNEFFRGWSTSPPANRLAFTDNLPVSGVGVMSSLASSVASGGAYDYAPAFVRFGCSARVVHFIGPGLAKPWRGTERFKSTGEIATIGGRLVDMVPQPVREFTSKWWDVHDRRVSGWHEGCGVQFDKEAALDGKLMLNATSSQQQPWQDLINEDALRYSRERYFKPIEPSASQTHESTPESASGASMSANIVGQSAIHPAQLSEQPSQPPSLPIPSSIAIPPHIVVTSPPHEQPSVDANAASTTVRPHHHHQQQHSHSISAQERQWPTSHVCDGEYLRSRVFQKDLVAKEALFVHPSMSSTIAPASVSNDHGTQAMRDAPIQVNPIIGDHPLPPHLLKSRLQRHHRHHSDQSKQQHQQQYQQQPETRSQKRLPQKITTESLAATSANALQHSHAPPHSQASQPHISAAAAASASAYEPSSTRQDVAIIQRENEETVGEFLESYHEQLIPHLVTSSNNNEPSILSHQHSFGNVPPSLHIPRDALVPVDLRAAEVIESGATVVQPNDAASSVSAPPPPIQGLKLDTAFTLRAVAGTNGEYECRLITSVSFNTPRGIIDHRQPPLPPTAALETAQQPQQPEEESGATPQPVHEAKPDEQLHEPHRGPYAWNLDELGWDVSTERAVAERLRRTPRLSVSGSHHSPNAALYGPSDGVDMDTEIPMEYDDAHDSDDDFHRLVTLPLRPTHQAAILPPQHLLMRSRSGSNLSPFLVSPSQVFVGAQPQQPQLQDLGDLSRNGSLRSVSSATFNNATNPVNFAYYRVAWNEDELSRVPRTPHTPRTPRTPSTPNVTMAHTISSGGVSILTQSPEDDVQFSLAVTSQSQFIIALPAVAPSSTSTNHADNGADDNDDNDDNDDGDDADIDDEAEGEESGEASNPNPDERWRAIMRRSCQSRRRQRQQQQQRQQQTRARADSVGARSPSDAAEPNRDAEQLRRPRSLSTIMSLSDFILDSADDSTSSGGNIL